MTRYCHACGIHKRCDSFSSSKSARCRECNAAQRAAGRESYRALQPVSKLPPAGAHKFGPALICEACGASWAGHQAAQRECAT